MGNCTNWLGTIAAAGFRVETAVMGETDGENMVSDDGASMGAEGVAVTIALG